MTSYFLRRSLQLLPILFGVILLNFLLFQVVAGSPASLVLGKGASAAELDEYDEQHGFNKPLVFGFWIKNRALADWDYGAAGRDFLPATNKNQLLLMPLRPQTRYRLRMVYSASNSSVIMEGCAPRVRWTSQQQAERTRGAHPSIIFDFKADENTCVQGLVSQLGKITLPPAKKQHVELDFQSGAKPSIGDILWDLPPGGIKIHSLQLRRHVDNPFDSQLVFYFRRLLALDFGKTVHSHEPVLRVLQRGVVPSLSLSIPIFLGSLFLSLLTALLSAYYRGRWPDHLFVLLATALMSVNYIIWVVAGQYLLAFKLGLFPVWGYESLYYLLLPIFVGILSSFGRDMRFYRTVLLDELYRDYVRTALAKGCSNWRVLWRHVLPNALLPVITNVSMSLPFLFTGNLLLESFFGIPGLGGLSISAIDEADMGVIQAVVFFGAVAYMVVNLVTDLLYAWADPRVRLE